MTYQTIDNILVFGEPLQNAVDQMVNCDRDADHTVLMADHHLGYAMPVGGVAAYKNYISPSGVGYDIACGNKAVRLNCRFQDIEHSIPDIMDMVVQQVSFGVGRTNKEKVDHPLFGSDTWNMDPVKELKEMARAQLGTVGSGNHYVDIFKDEQDRIWVGVHFGSRGLGHKIATHFVKAGGGKDGIHVDPVLLETSSDLGQQYLAAMSLAGEYAYAGRDWVCNKVAAIIGADIEEEIHNHHNFAWEERHFGETYWVVRKGATPAFPGQLGFVGATMTEPSVILEGVDSEVSMNSLYSTVHGAGRVMSRTEAAGKRRWKKGKQVTLSEGKVTQEMMNEEVIKANIVLRGAGRDEAPQCYKRLDEVLEYHKGTVKILHTLIPLGVAMAGANEFDPFRD